MQYETIRYVVRDDIAIVTMNRADVMNALNTQMRAELADAVKRAGTEARVMVLTGSGRAFCAGQDLGDGANPGDIDLERLLRDEYTPMLHEIYESPIPTVAAVNGAAAGAGANLALACDVVIATESATFLQAVTRIGLIPDAGGTYWLPRKMGFAKAMGATLFAEPMSAKEADALGMIWEAVPDAEFADHWWRRALHLAKGPTAAYAHVKRAIRESLNHDLTTQLELEARLQGECGKTRDFKEGIVAFIEKRPAQFEGR